MKTLLSILLDMFAPNRATNKKTDYTIYAIHAILLVSLWSFTPWKLMPTPWEVWQAFVRLWNQGLGHDLYASFILNVEALVISAGIALVFAYMTAIPFFKFTATILSKFRFMGILGWSIAFLLMFGAGHYLKVALLVFGQTAFMLTGMSMVINQIPKVKYDHARTLRMGELRVIWEVVVLGTIVQMLEVIIQNAAIGWTMLTMVEGISRSEGGIGVLLISQNKFLKLDGIFAIQLTIFFLALIQDWIFRFAMMMAFPWAYLGKERS